MFQEGIHTFLKFNLLEIETKKISFVLLALIHMFNSK